MEVVRRRALPPHLLLRRVLHLLLVVHLEDVGQLVQQRLVPERDAYVRHVRARNVVAGDALARIVRPEPVLLHLVRKARHQHAVPGELAHVARAELPHLGRNAVLLHQRFLFQEKNGGDQRHVSAKDM